MENTKTIVEKLQCKQTEGEKEQAMKSLQGMVYEGLFGNKTHFV